jgi:hypothetical protein
MYGDRRGAYRVLLGRPEGRRPLERPRHRWEDNIKMDLSRSEMGEVGMDWIDPALDRDRWRTLTNSLVTLHKIRGIS